MRFNPLDIGVWREVWLVHLRPHRRRAKAHSCGLCLSSANDRIRGVKLVWRNSPIHSKPTPR